MSLPLDIDALSPEDQERILKLATQRAAQTYPFKSLMELVASPDGFGLDIEGTMSDLQKFLCCVVDGTTLVPYKDMKATKEALGVKTIKESYGRPKEVIVLAAVRTAKSLISAANAIHASQTVKIPSWVGPGEIPRYSILSLELDNAKVVLSHLLGALGKPALQGLRVPKRQEDILADTGAEVVGSIHVYNKQGRIIEIRVVAGKKAGGSLVSRWSVGATLDEAPRMVGSSEAVINYDDSHRAVRSRLLPGAQILSIGSPWQPYGPIYDIFQEEFGQPTSKRVVFRATGPAMNPVWWNEERVSELRDSKNRNDQLVYQTDVLAQFADEEEMLFSQALLSQCLRRGDYPVPRKPRCDYVAAIDPATRGNAWTLVVCGRRGRTKSVVYHAEWRGKPNSPLSPRKVIGEIAQICGSYGLTWAYTDQWAADAIKDIGYEEGFTFADIDWTEKEKTDTFTSLAAAMADGTVELPNDPQLLKDLKMVKKKPTNRGFSIQLPSTTDGRHCDYAPALARCLKQWIDDELPVIPERGTKEWEDMYEARLEQQDEAEFEKLGRDPFTEQWEDEDPWESWERDKRMRAMAKDLING